MVYTIKERQEFERQSRMYVDQDWIEAQVKRSGLVTKDKAVLSKIISILDERGYRPEDTELVDQILSYASSLTKGQPIKVDTPDEYANAAWVQAVRGEISERDTVRVKSDAYTQKFGVQHNGRIGHVTNIRGDDIKVIYLGEGADDVVGHNLVNLEKRV